MLFQRAAAAQPPQTRLSSRWQMMLLIFWLVFAVGQLVDTTVAQNRTSNATTTDPSEGFVCWRKFGLRRITWAPPIVENLNHESIYSNWAPIGVALSNLFSDTTYFQSRFLNSMFLRWGISAADGWNISGELCSGVAADSTTQLGDMNPGLKCDCSYNNGSTCHITGLRLFELDIVGPIPDELWSLSYLDDLDMRQNYFTGPLSPSIGNLTRMQYMSFGLNALSGELPRELGRLTDLRSISITANNFSGPIPAELGNLSRLTQMYIHGSGVSGPIPPSFANLQSMQTAWASDNELTGQIPDFIGNWSSLIQLRLQGNSFQGSIPPSFSNLTSLVDLRISDLSNGSSSLEFLRDMSSLSTIILRNNRISGSVPSYLSEFRSLQLLDLSFNNLTGRIPDALFNHSSLTNLFLGNNRLTGGLPPQRSPSLRNIDLSYNELSGSFPSWLSAQNLQLNLVANNFTIEGSNGRGVFLAIEGDQFDSSFAIKCGGPQITSSDQIVYERENETLGPATYYVTSARRWAISTAGLFADNTNPQYTSVTTSPVTNTLDSQLYQTARVSSGSLRYYGLSMENGNYTVRLQFAETAVLNTRTWESLGRRVFDIYIQGNLEVKDFDIRREAGGVSFRAVDRSFNVRVSENYLEVHLFWAGKGTCCGPSRAVNGPLISAIRATPNFSPTVSNNPPSEKKNRTGVIVGVIVPITAAGLLCLFAAYYYVYRRRKQQKDFEDDGKEKQLGDSKLLGLEARPYTFSYAELKAATNDFNPDNKLGEGGFGPVYKGSLGDGRAVAVKQLSVGSRQGKSQFLAEIATISAVRHRNLVKLYGCCIEGDKRLLVYEYLENKSLDQLLFGKKLYLDWKTRCQICLGVARGLAYLHEEAQPRIVHRDVKASNILLDSQLDPKISDFGLAKLYDDKITHMSTGVAGTIGYLAPEYALRGHLTEKADTFSFGVVALEIISGRSNSDSSLEDDRIYLLDWAWNLHESNRQVELVDPSLDDDAIEEEARRIMGVALLCTQGTPGLRPAMSRVVSMICGDIEVPAVTTRPSYLTDWAFNDSTTINNLSTSNADDISPANFTTTTTSTSMTTI
ncbi:hypothetical protein OROHE_005826 [Orobanche hederae]